MVYISSIIKWTFWTVKTALKNSMKFVEVYVILWPSIINEI